MGQPEGRKSQQDDPYHRAETLPARIGLLDDHDPGQHRHRQQASYANPKQDQQQPRQNAPWRRPRCQAAPTPLR